MLDLVLLGGSDDAVLEGDVLCVVETHALPYAVEAHAVEEDVMYRQTLQTGHVHCLAGVDSRDVAEGEIAPLGVELALVIRIRGTAATCRTVCVTRLEEDSRLADVLHCDVVAVDVLAPTATTRSGFETAADIRAVEHTILDDQTLHTAAELRTDDEAAVRTIDGVVGDEEVALRTGSHTFVAHAAFHTDTPFIQIPSSPALTWHPAMRATCTLPGSMASPF